jgi:hypothetical protein
MVAVHLCSAFFARHRVEQNVLYGHGDSEVAEHGRPERARLAQLVALQDLANIAVWHKK